MILSTLLYPLTPSSTGTLATVTGVDRVLQGVALFFQTRKGDRALVPEFGVPPLPTSAEAVPAWNAEVEAGLLMVSSVVTARVQAALESGGRLRGRATIFTNGQEALNYDITINPNP